ncbi:hypothetical protein SAY86_029085 [Trapa natans]|uniref:Uncharacterized protein n=1 Tax=Trapa natans TaxID=22666 RepID=A0AAN7R984_TRANT|nr:hypothetical protein SAY86_029085 [Trapa natans]
MSEVIRTWSLGHWTCECKNERVYISRPSRTQMLKNPNLNMMGCVSYDHENLDSKKEEKAWKRSKKRKRKHRFDSSSTSDSGALVFENEGGSRSGTIRRSRRAKGRSFACLREITS